MFPFTQLGEMLSVGSVSTTTAYEVELLIGSNLVGHALLEPETILTITIGAASSIRGSPGGFELDSKGPIIIRYPGAARGTGGEVTTDDAMTTHTFIAAGTFIA